MRLRVGEDRASAVVDLADSTSGRSGGDWMSGHQPPSIAWVSLRVATCWRGTGPATAAFRSGAAIPPCVTGRDLMRAPGQPAGGLLGRCGRSRTCRRPDGRSGGCVPLSSGHARVLVVEANTFADLIGKPCLDARTHDPRVLARRWLDRGACISARSQGVRVKMSGTGRTTA